MNATSIQADRAVMPADELVSLMRYKAWADAEMMTAARALPWLGRFLVGRYVAAIARHFHTVDCIFRAHLLGVSHPHTSTNPPEPSQLERLAVRMAETDNWYVEYVRELDARCLREPLHVTFTDGERQLLTRSDMLMHVSHHAAYHRGNIGILLRVGGAGALPDRFTSYLRTTGSPIQAAS